MLLCQLLQRARQCSSSRHTPCKSTQLLCHWTAPSTGVFTGKSKTGGTRPHGRRWPGVGGHELAALKRENQQVWARVDDLERYREEVEAPLERSTEHTLR